MFLSKKCLDGDNDTVPMLRAGHAWAGSDGGGLDGQQEIVAPASAVNMREKMLQQRKKALAKQSGAGNCSTSMVTANKGQPVVESNVASPSRPSTTAGIYSFSKQSTQPTASSPTGADKSPLAASFSKDSSGEEPMTSGLIAPDVQNEAEEEIASRNNSNAGPPRDPSILLQELSARGISSVFDPTTGSSGEKLPTFDISSVGPQDMRAFLHNPAPKSAGMLQCRIVRDRGMFNKLYPKFRMESDSGVFLMTAQKQGQNKTSNYSITMSKTDTNKESDSFLGKLRSNFYGLEFVAYGPGLNPSKCDAKQPQSSAIQQAREELCAITYSSSMWGGSKPRGPRKMTTILPCIQNGERLVCRTLRPDQEGLVALQKADETKLIHTYQNKSPKWNDSIGAYVLNFNKRVTEASVKNFQLTSSEDPDTVYLQFGRVGKEAFNIDFQYPMSPFQAFAICLSSFDYKLCCE